jgi:hypothetical protein
VTPRNASTPANERDTEEARSVPGPSSVPVTSG